MEFAKKCRSQLLIMFCCLLDQSIQPDALLAANENIWKSTSNKFVRGSHWDSATAANRLHLRTAKLYVFEGTQKDLVEVFANPVDAEKFYCAFIPTDKNLFQQITMFS